MGYLSLYGFIYKSFINIGRIKNALYQFLIFWGFLLDLPLGALPTLGVSVSSPCYIFI